MFFAPHPWNFILSLQSWFWQRVMIFCHPPRPRSALALIWAEFKFDKCPVDTMWLAPCAPDCRVLSQMLSAKLYRFSSFIIFLSTMWLNLNLFNLRQERRGQKATLTWGQSKLKEITTCVIRNMFLFIQYFFQNCQRKLDGSIQSGTC